jgi:FAD-linked oxidoreductase
MADRRPGIWRNWAGNQRVRPTAVHRPRTAGEVAAVVRAAREDGRRVKAIGSGHSFTGAALAPDVQLDLRHLTGLRAVDPATGLVTVAAGTTLHELNRLLEGAGLALSNLGDIDRQTVAGALSTGTHGTGAKLGGLATQVRGLELVTGDGELVRCGPAERPELFAAARVGLGALGVLTAVTLQAEPRFVLHAQERPLPLPQVLAELDDLVATNEHFEFFWWPHTGTALTKRNNRLPAGAAAQPLRPVRAFVEDEVVGNGLFGLLCRVGRARPELVPRISGYAARTMGDREYSDSSHKVFVSPRRVRFVEMEYAVPRDAVREALDGIGRVIDRLDLRISFPVEVRFTAADDIPLSTASGRESAYLAVHVVRGEPHETYFDAVEAVMDALDGRPHWGKLHGQTAETLRRRYPRFDEFLAARRAVDPAGTFANAYTDRVLGPVERLG